MSVQAENIRATRRAAARRAAPRAALAVLGRAWTWLVLERVDEPSARQRAFVERTMRVAPVHWR